MSQVSTTAWSTFGWIATTLVVFSIPLGLADPVLGVFVLYAAIIIGGFSGIGRNATAKFGITTILASLLLTLLATHYSSSTGFYLPQFRLILNAFVVLWLPLLISAALLFLGATKRRYSDRRTFDD